MDKIILKAKIILGDIFNIQTIHFENNTSRKKNIVEARRFLVYYLREYLQMNYSEINRKIPALSNHATALFHYNKMKTHLEIYSDTRRKYDIFHSKLNSENFSDIQQEMNRLINSRKDLNKQINSIRKIL